MASAAFIESIKCLSDSDKNRLICVLLHSSFTNSQIDWEAATSAFGANSKASMQRMYHAARQKHREQNGLQPLETVASTPKKAPGRQSTKNGDGGKRKLVNSDDDGDDDEDLKPKKTKTTTESPTKAASKRQKTRPPSKVVKEEFQNEESENDQAKGIFC